MSTSTKIFIPRDTASLSMGGDEVASKIEEIAQKEKKRSYDYSKWIMGYELARTTY
jgi:hypothetical protein